MFRADFFLQVDVFLFQLGVERADFFIRLHVLHGERNLIGYFLQQFSIRIRILVGSIAREVQSSNTFACDDKGSDTNRTNTLLR